MKKVDLRQALQELKQARGLAERIAATSRLVNQTAYKAGKLLYGASEKPQPKPAAPPQTVPTADTNPTTAQSTTAIEFLEPVQPVITPPASTEPALSSLQPPASDLSTGTPLNSIVNSYTNELANINEKLKDLRFQKERAHTDVELNAIHFKILRLERERRAYIEKIKRNYPAT